MPRVLVVDDEPDVREVLRRALSHWGYEVMEAGDGSEALEKCSWALPDIVLMDVAMPVMDGFQALRKLRESPSFGSTPVVLVTTHPASVGEPIAMSLGCQHYISKPFDLDVLNSTIKVALRESQSVEDNVQSTPPIPAATPEPRAPEQNLTRDPSGDEAPRPALLRTGIEVIDDELGGGILPQSLTLVEGTLDVGKSILCHHLTHVNLINELPVIYISSEESEQSLVERLSSIGIGVSDYIGNTRLQVRCLQDHDPEEDSDRTIAALYQLVSQGPEADETVIIDSISNRSIYGQEQAIVSLFQLCKDHCKMGQTICIVTHSGILEEKVWLKLRPLLDTHIRLSLQPMGRNLVKTLEVLKLNNAEVHTGNRIAFDVQPGVGIVPTRLPGYTG